MSKKHTVCVLTAGKGTRMGSYAEHVNKALMPLGKKAIISHIIGLFPEDTEFVVALGHLGKQVRNYLSIAHPRTHIHFVEVENYEGPGSGPGHSLLCCEALLQKPFYFVSCDTLWSDTLEMDLDENWMGVAEVKPADTDRYCNFEIAAGRVVGVKDKEHAVWPPYKAFVGLCYFKDFKIFWNGLKTVTMIAGEHQVSNGVQAVIEQCAPLALDVLGWVDVGNLEQYREAVLRHEPFDFSKDKEFLYICNGKVIKFFADASIAQRRVDKAKLNPSVFPKITDVREQFYAYDFIEGETLYQFNNAEVFSRFLSWLKVNLWKPAGVPESEMRVICRKFYHDKTMQRLRLFREKHGVDDGETTINGERVPPTSELLAGIAWEELYDGIPVFFHGDLQFDNVLYSEGRDDFVLLDWRQEFGGRVDLGDLYYDLAKLYGGILLNYDFIKLNLLSYHEKSGRITIDFAQRFLSDTFEKILCEYIAGNGWDVRKVKVLVGLIYLNMSPLHHSPFDKMLYSLGRLMLHRETRA
jgi:NDP-sugar pyrophosphorylase family protein